MILYCVRHGESCYNAEGRLQGQSLTPLSALGQRQAAAAARAAADAQPIKVDLHEPFAARPADGRSGWLVPSGRSS